MASPTTFTNDVICQQNFGVTGDLSTPWARSHMRQRDLEEYVVPLTDLRIWNAFHTVLTGTANTDDLALVGGTFGSASPTIQTMDSDNITIQQFARFVFALPPEYVAGETVVLRIHAGVNTSVASSSATVDAVVYRMDSTAGIGSDLCATSAISINSTTNANKDFTITAATLGPGDQLDVRIVIDIVDSGAGTATIGEIGKISFLLDIKP